MQRRGPASRRSCGNAETSGPPDILINVFNFLFSIIYVQGRGRVRGRGGTEEGMAYHLQELRSRYGVPIVGNERVKIMGFSVVIKKLLPVCNSLPIIH